MAALAWPPPAPAADAVPAAALTISVQPSAIALPVMVAQARGFFVAEGVDVRTLDCDGGARCLRTLLDGSAELTTASEFPVVLASFDTSPVAIVSTIATSTRNLRVLGRKSAGTSRAQALAGKRIGVTFGVSSHYYLNLYLLYQGIDPQDCRIVDIEPSKLADALVHGRIDAMAGFGRQFGPALKLLGGDGVLLENPRVYTETYHLIATRRALAERPAEVTAVLRALDRAERFIREQPQAVSLLLQSRLKVDAAYADAVPSLFDFRLGLDQSLVTTMEGEARWAMREGLVAASARAPNLLNFVDAGPLTRAVPSTSVR